MEEFLLNSSIPKLPEPDKVFSDQTITIEECLKALQGLSYNKSPDCDGMPVEFYKFFCSYCF